MLNKMGVIVVEGNGPEINASLPLCQVHLYQLLHIPPVQTFSQPERPQDKTLGVLGRNARKLRPGSGSEGSRPSAT